MGSSHGLAGCSAGCQRHGAIHDVGSWFWNFLKTELSPYPGRAWVVGRMTIAATIVMLLVMTFRLPFGFLGATFTLLLSRESPTATLRAGVRTIAGFAVATAYSIVGIMMLIDDPVTHFLWIVVTLFISYYLIRIIPDYGTAVSFGFMVGGVIPQWDMTLIPVETRVENTLWLAFSVFVGSAVTIAVEYLFRNVHPQTDLMQGIDTRLGVVEDVLRNIASGLPFDSKIEKEVALYPSLGTSRLQRLLVRSSYSPQFVAQMNAVVALVGRMVDIAASLRLLAQQGNNDLSADDRKRCTWLADSIRTLRKDLEQGKPLRSPEFPAAEQASSLPFLSAMERMAGLIPRAFSDQQATSDVFVPSPMDDGPPQRWLVRDAFSNPEYVKFALRGTLASGACYVVYTALDYRALSTSIVTCLITALSTIGSSRQKQVLRFAGAFIGGIVFGMGAQIFVLPYLDSITGFTVLFAIVTAISSWIATATPRLSYLGVQLALAFYLINLQEFTIQTSLSIARDRVFGVLLGLLAMWLLFDRIWVRGALEEMQSGFARNLESFAELTEASAQTDRDAAIRQARVLRDRINAGFVAVKTQSDAVPFEFGRMRRQKLNMRANIQRWQPLLRTAALMQITFLQYRLAASRRPVPEEINRAEAAFERDLGRFARSLAAQFAGKAPESVAEIRESAAKLQRDVEAYAAESQQTLSSQSSDVIRLTQGQALVLGELADDISATLDDPERAPHPPLTGAHEAAV